MARLTRGRVSHVHLSQQVHDECRDGPQTVAHLAQRMESVVPLDPQSFRVDVHDTAIVGEQAVAEDRQRRPLQLGGSGIAFEGPQMLSDEPGDAVGQRRLLVEEGAQARQGARALVA